MTITHKFGADMMMLLSLEEMGLAVSLFPLLR